MKKVTDNLTLPVLISWMKHYVAVSSQDQRIRAIAKQCKTKQDPVYCVYKAILNRVDYERDPVGESGQIHRLKGASAAFRKGKGNCHTYAILNAAVLLNMGIPVKWRFYSFKGKSWDHVVTVADGKVLDQSVSENVSKEQALELFNTEPVTWSDKKDITLSKLLLLQGNNNPDYYNKKPVNKERAERLGLFNKNLVGVQGKADIQKRLKDVIRQKWLAKFNHWAGEDWLNWEVRDDNLQEIRNKGVQQFTEDLVKWYQNAAKGYDVDDETKKKAAKRIEANVSKFLANTLISEFQKSNWEQAILSLKDKVVIPKSFKKLKEGDDNWGDKFEKASIWFVATYFDHVEKMTSEERTPSGGLMYPQLYTRGDFGNNAFEVIRNRFDYFVERWAENYDKPDSYSMKDKEKTKRLPSPFIKTVSNQEAKQRANEVAKELPISVLEQTSSKSEAEKQSSAGPLGLGIGVGLSVLKGLL